MSPMQQTRAELLQLKHDHETLQSKHDDLEKRFKALVEEVGTVRSQQRSDVEGLQKMAADEARREPRRQVPRPAKGHGG